MAKKLKDLKVIETAQSRGTDSVQCEKANYSGDL